MTIAEHVRMLGAVMVFDPVDAFAVRRSTVGPHARPVGTIAYRVVAQLQGGVRTDLDPPLDLAVTRTRSGYDVWFGVVCAPTIGLQRIGLADGDYLIEASSPLYQRLEAPVTVPLDPAAPGRFELDSRSQRVSRTN